MVTSLGSLSMPKPISLKAVTVKLYVTPGWRLSINCCLSDELTVLWVPFRKGGSENRTLSYTIEKINTMMQSIKVNSSNTHNVQIQISLHALDDTVTVLSTALCWIGVNWSGSNQT